MTIVIKQHEENGIYVVMEVRGGVCVVNACQCQGNNMYGYPVAASKAYAVGDKRAEATFRRYVKKYCKGE